MRSARSLVVALLALVAVLATRPVFADEGLPPAPLPATARVRVAIPGEGDASQTSTPGTKSPLKEPDKTVPRYWAQGPTRTFTSIAVDVGFLYLRPRVSFGYGHPFWSWIGVDVNPQASGNFAAGYAGLRLALPRVDLRIGPRYVFSYRRSYLEPRSNFSRLQFESQEHERSTYVALESEIAGGLPAGPGSLLFVASGTYLTGVPKDLYVYDETLRVIAKAPWLWRARVGYAVRLGIEGKISVGLVTEVLGNPGRAHEIFRAGIIGSAALSNHIEVLGSLVLPIITSDTLGIFGGEFGQLGVRYRWATGQAKDVPVERIERVD